MRKIQAKTGAFLASGVVLAGTASGEMVQYTHQARSIECWAYAQNWSSTSERSDRADAPDFSEFARSVSVAASAGSGAAATTRADQSSAMDRSLIHGTILARGTGSAFNFGYAAGSADSDFSLTFRLLEPHGVLLSASLTISENIEDSDELYLASVELRRTDELVWNQEITEAGTSGRFAYESVLLPGEYELEGHASLFFATEWENQNASVQADFSLQFMPSPPTAAVLAPAIAVTRRRRSRREA